MASEADTTTTSKTVPKFGKDVFWEYGEKVGAKVRCTFCNHSVSGGISRLKQHLAHERGNCVPCKSVPNDVKDKARAALDAVKLSKVTKEAKHQTDRDEVVIGEDVGIEQSCVGIPSSMMGSSTSSNKGPMDKHVQTQSEPKGPARPGEKVQTTLNQHWKKKCREDACEWIARAIFENALPFNIVNSKSWRQMVEAIGKFGENLKGPTAYELGEKYLPMEVATKKESLRSFLESCKIHGCSLMSDAWTDRKGRSIMNLVVNCYSGTMFYGSENTSKDIHDGYFIYKLIDNTIEKLGEECVVQVVTDNASNNVAAAKLLDVRRPHIFWTFCGAHTVNLMLKDIAAIKPIRSAIVMAREVTVFVYNHTLVLDWMRECTGGDLIRPGITRFATAFLSLQSIKEKKKGLKKMVNLSHWDDHLAQSSTTMGRKVYKIINSRQFWENVTLALNIFEPLVKVLRRSDSDVPSMGWLYGDLEMARNEIGVNLNHKEKRCRPIWLIIDKRWDNKLKSPLHLAGHFLNPFFYYQRREHIEKNGSFLGAFTDCLYKMYRNDPEMQDKICAQLPLYQNKTGSFGRDMAIRQMKSLSLDPGIFS